MHSIVGTWVVATLNIFTYIWVLLDLLNVLLTIPVQSISFKILSQNIIFFFLKEAVVDVRNLSNIHLNLKYRNKIAHVCLYNGRIVVIFILLTSGDVLYDIILPIRKSASSLYHTFQPHWCTEIRLRRSLFYMFAQGVWVVPRLSRGLNNQ